MEQRHRQLHRLPVHNRSGAGKKFSEHVKSFDLDLKEGTFVESVERREKTFIVKTKSKIYEGKTVIISTGRRPKMLNVPGEMEFRHWGVSYCATCDAPLYKNKTVAVIGGGNSALDAVLQLMNIAKKVYLINRDEKFGADAIMLDKAEKSKKVEMLVSTRVRKISGDNFVKTITVVRGNVEDMAIDVDVDGVFIEIGSEPVQVPVISLTGLEKNSQDEIIVDEKCETCVPGLFAAGDVTNIPEK
ncbi:MAG: NAD(P)/FAD-dependent oxidoreductase [Candidatus Aenigmatarchaeota archaeon]